MLAQAEGTLRVARGFRTGIGVARRAEEGIARRLGLSDRGFEFGNGIRRRPIGRRGTACRRWIACGLARQLFGLPVADVAEHAVVQMGAPTARQRRIAIDCALGSIEITGAEGSDSKVVLERGCLRRGLGATLVRGLRAGKVPRGELLGPRSRILRAQHEEHTGQEAHRRRPWVVTRS